MATQLDLQEQEQLDELKAFWKQYGNLITWVLILVLGAFAAWNGWNWYQREQAGKASAMFDELERAAQAGDAEKAGKVFSDLKARYPRTAFAEQGGLLAAKVQYEKGQADGAKATLAWVADNATENEYKTIARLRLAGVLLDQKQYDEALKQLASASGKEFEALVADRRGDVLLAQGKKDDAKAAYQAAWKAMDEKLEYRRLVDAKLTALGAPPEPAAGASAPAGAKQ
ncbi:YfgM family protein [Ideonella sp. BN130291]|uniref:YfgM family protein n=1 Tax=Ideonella sp. BN130291 TaxID=3112940 RepID=UPI002E25D014|nr:tetratricopeptide repeat protein [Ideonella sp. BN130291]